MPESQPNCLKATLFAEVNPPPLTLRNAGFLQGYPTFPIHYQLCHINQTHSLPRYKRMSLQTGVLFNPANLSDFFIIGIGLF